MKHIQFSAEQASKLDAPTQLAFDEALLLAAEDDQIGPTFRTWELPAVAVVLGRSSKSHLETDQAYCRANQIPTYRRCSGGASIVAGPGCLMYSVVLSSTHHPGVLKIDGAHDYVMDRVLAAVRRQLPEANRQGICDLAYQTRKFSGNALRITRRHVLYHGTLLYGVDIDQVSRCLDFAPRQPDYRAGRDHESFITNAPLQPAVLTRDLALQFNACEDDSLVGDLSHVVWQRARELVSNRYSRQEWSFRH